MKKLFLGAMALLAAVTFGGMWVKKRRLRIY